MATFVPHPGSTRRKTAKAPRDAVWINNGRLVSHTISEPEIKREILIRFAEMRKDPDALRAHYIKQGFLSPAGKLAKRYGG